LYWNTRKLLTDSYLKLDGVIAITSHIEDIYKEKGIPALKVPALIAPDFYAGIPDSQFDKTQSPIILTYVGSLAAKDDPLLMLDVLKILVQKKIDVKLMIIGSIIKSDISDKFLSTLKNDDELKTRIIIKGRVSDSDLKHSLKSSHILLLPRLKKPGVIAAFPTRLPELLLTGRPCVTTDVGDLKGYIQDGVHARLAVPGDAADMAQKIISIIEDPNFSEQLGANGKECARTRFNFEAYAQPLSSFLELKR
jgi:glycosyltransferase involved in cell wall biosynthesis